MSGTFSLLPVFRKYIIIDISMDLFFFSSMLRHYTLSRSSANYFGLLFVDVFDCIFFGIFKFGYWTYFVCVCVPIKLYL